MANKLAAEHFAHAADTVVRGIGRTKGQAFEQAAFGPRHREGADRRAKSGPEHWPGF